MKVGLDSQIEGNLYSSLLSFVTDTVLGISVISSWTQDILM